MINLDSLNYFHDWVLENLTVSNDLTLVLEIVDESNITHSAVVLFGQVSDLVFIDYQTPPFLESQDKSLIRKLACNRWLQTVQAREGRTEIGFVGGNDFSDSNAAKLTFKHNFIKLAINEQVVNDEGELKSLL